MSAPRRVSIKLKIAVGYILIICCLGTAIAIFSNRISTLQSEIESITSQDMEINNLITSVRYNVINMESSQRGFLLTGKESYLEPYYQAIEEWEMNFNQLYALLSQDPNKLRDLESIKAIIVNWIEVTGKPTIEMKQTGRDDEISNFFLVDPGKSDTDKLRQLLEELRAKHLDTNRQYISSLDKRNQELMIGLIGILVGVAIISLFVVAYVSGTIVRTIRQVTATIHNINESKGGLDKRIHVRSNDEIQDLADATNAMLCNLEDKSWVQSNVAEIVTNNQGISNLKELASAFLSQVAPMIGATLGVIYYRAGTGDAQRLIKLAAYAETGSDRSRDSFSLGEGLVGQSAMDKRPFLLNKPDDYDNVITSGLTEMQPKSVLVVPVEFEQKVIAVMEFASLESFASKHLNLLEAIEEYMGVTFDNVIGHMEVERLLGESQALTEELQAQTEELQAQSEELQMQQEEMRMTTEHLEEQNLIAEQKTKELEAAKEELENYAEKLEQSSQYKTNFLANMSHELRTPLNSILILSQMLYENENKTLSRDEESYARVIHSSGKDLLSLIDDILDLSKVEAGRIELISDQISVHEVPEILKLSFDPIAEQKGVSFIVELDSDVPDVIQTDGQRLQQILKNLLSNAFKFTERGSVTLKLHKADSAAVGKHLPHTDSEDIIAFSVIDTGIGIPKDKQQLIFEAFKQVDGNTNRIYGGTGLGLSICHEFAQLLGGAIVVDSQPHKGSVFTLYLPTDLEAVQAAILKGTQEVAAGSEQIELSPLEHDPSEHEPDNVQPAAGQEDENAAAKQQRLSSEAMIFAGKRVLLVEDDARNVYAVKKALEQKGLLITVAGNGQKCLDIIHTDADFDLVLMDIMMPVMDGFETMRALREHPTMKDTPIIALTAKAMKSDQEACLEAGASDYISKPLHMEQLYSLMRVWLTKQVSHE